MSDGDRTGPDAGAAAGDAADGTADARAADADAAGANDEEPDAAPRARRNPDGTGVDLSAAPAPGDGLVTLDPRVRLVWVAQAAVTAVVFGLIAAVGGLVVLDDLLPGVVVAVVAFGLGSVHALLRYRVWRYEVREESLYLEHGVVTRVTTVVPYVRIQHVDASRGPVERLAGLSTVVVYTAGSRGADVSIPGLTPEGAEALQHRLERLAIAAEGEDAV